MDIKDIVEYFAARYPSFGIKVLDFTRPERQTWQKTFTLLACNTMIITPDVIQQGVGLMGNQLDYPELHEDSMPIMRLLAAMVLIGKMCHFDFDLTDILEPKQKRLQRICTAIIRFLEFRDTKQDLLQQIRNENAVRLNQFHKVEAENEELKKQINARRYQRSSQEPEIARLKAENEKQLEAFTTLETHIAEKKKTLDNLKQALIQAENNAARIREELQRVREEGDKLDELIVPSPERLKEAMDQLRSELVNVAQAKKDKTLSLLEVRQRLDYIEQYDAELAPMIKRAQGIEKECQAIKVGKIEVNKQTAVRDAELLRMREVNQRVQLLEEQLKLAEERQQKLTMQGEAKVRAKSQDIDRIISELDALHVRQASVDKTNEKYAEEVRQLRKEMSDVELEYRTMIADVLQMGRELHNNLEDYNHILRNAYLDYLKQMDLPLDLPSPILPPGITK